MWKSCQDIGNSRGRERMADAGNMLKGISYNEPIYLLVQISLIFVPVFLIYNNWHQAFVKTNNDQVHCPTHLCVTQQVKSLVPGGCGSDLKNGQLQT